MTPKARTLLLILAFVALTFGSFIWFIARWDPAREQPVVETTEPLHGDGEILIRKGKA